MTEENKRPTFLTVLCILTFIWSGLTVLFSTNALIGGRMSPEQIENSKLQLMEAYDDDAPEVVNEFLLKSIEVLEIQNNNFFAITATGLLASLMAVFGALLMFKLNRKGFGLYIFAQAIPIFISFYYYGTNIAAVVSVIIQLFISLLFIFMYMVNLKHMKN